MVVVVLVMMIRRLSRPGPDKTSSSILMGRWIHLMMMLVVLGGGGGLEKRTTPTLLHDETNKTTKPSLGRRRRRRKNRRHSVVVLRGMWIYRERSKILVFMRNVTIFYSKKNEMFDSNFFFV